MPGSLVHDANSPNLLTGATLNAAGTTNSNIVQVDRPGDVSVVLVTSTVTGTTPTIAITVSSSDDPAFSTGIVGHGTFGLATGNAAAQSNVEKKLMVYIHKRYVRLSVVAGGTSPVYTGSTVKIEQEFVNQTDNTSAS